MDIIEKMENKITKKSINMFDNLKEVNNIEDKIIFDFGIEENLIDQIYILIIIYKKYMINIKKFMVIVNGII